MAQEPKHEFRFTVTTDARLKMEALKNQLGLPTMGDVLLQAVVLFDLSVKAEKKGGRILMEIPGEETTILRITSNAPDCTSSSTEDLRRGHSGDSSTPASSSQ